MLAEPESNPPRHRPPYGIYAYTAREWDPEINLYYYRARYYDPRIGRFISEDPIRFAGGKNFYRYVDNDPVGRADPWGLQGADVPEQPTPTPSPTPCGRPYEPPPKPGFWGWFFKGNPRIQNPCPDGTDPVRIDDTGPNPHTEYGAWVTWKNAFISCCEGMGTDYVAHCPPAGVNQTGGEGQVSVCLCCKRCEE